VSVFNDVRIYSELEFINSFFLACCKLVGDITIVLYTPIVLVACEEEHSVCK